MPGRLTSILVQPVRGREREVRAELERLAAGRLNVQSAELRAPPSSARRPAPNNQSAELFSVIGALVGFLFAFNAMMLTVLPAPNLVEDLRLDGYSRRMIVEVLLFDALVLGIAASLLGLVLGDLLSLVLFDSNPGYLSFAFPIAAQRIVTWQSVAARRGRGAAGGHGRRAHPAAQGRSSRAAPLGPVAGRARSGTASRIVLGELACLGITAVHPAGGPRVLRSSGSSSLVARAATCLPWSIGAVALVGGSPAAVAGRHGGSTLR